MSWQNWLAIGAAAIIAAFVALFATPGVSHAPKPLPPSAPGFAALGAVPSGFPALAPPGGAPSIATSSAAASASSASATTARAVSSSQSAPAKPAPSASPAVQPAPAPAASAPAQQAPSATATSVLDTTIGLVRGALVNIICVPTAPNLKTASATGVVIDPRGIIMTVAHMAQFFLLADYPQRGGTTCVIRAGSPAKTAYTASLIYISPEWVKNNPTTLVESVPTGTGEDDFAFLAITGSAIGDRLPGSFTAIPLSHADPAQNAPVTIGSYGAEFLDTAQIKSELYPIVVFGSVTDRYTFRNNTEDLISVTNTAAAQEGSSGGVIVGAGDTAVGLITTSSLTAGSVTSRTLHAITANYIRREFQAETGDSLDDYLASSTLPALVHEFSSQAAGLSSFLESKIK